MDTYGGPVVDSHFHVWYCPGEKYDFPTPDMSISGDISLDDYQRAISTTNIQASVFVQVLNSNENEIDWMHQLSKKYSVVKGMVGGVDLSDPEFGDKVGCLIEKTGGLLKGIRHILEGLPESEMLDWLRSDVVAQNVALLSRNNLSFDLLLKPNLIEPAYQLVKRCPQTMFVVDHIAKPNVNDKEFDKWAADMERLSKEPNVYCKISGLVVLADCEKGDIIADKFLPYVQHIVSCFGTKRIMFGSDWPVCHLADFSMSDVVRLAEELMVMCGLNTEEMQAFFYTNGSTFYRLQ